MPQGANRPPSPHRTRWMGQRPKLPPQAPHPWVGLAIQILLALALVWFWQQSFHEARFTTIPYSEFKKLLAQKEIAELWIGPDEIRGRLEGPSAKGTIGKFFRTVRLEDPTLVQELQSSGVRYQATRPSFLGTLFFSWILPLMVLLGLWVLFTRLAGVGGGAHPLLSFGKSRALLIKGERTGVTFEDVAGCDEAKFELQEIVDFLKNPARYRSLGARIPKGVLLVGPPGTGKTLLARAIAGEAGVPFFSISGSDFVEMFVGVGAARMRDLFAQAKKQAPCIIFIDELDAIGRQRGARVIVSHDEQEQTLNQLLVEMDGFNPNVGIIVLGATNRPEILDRALLRPGRFDRQVVVDLPDLDGREAILRVHARGKPLDSHVDLRRIAQATPGFSGADLANLINEAALLAARRNAKAITQEDLEAALEKIVAGPEKRSRRLREEERRRVAIHEVGHALVAAFSPAADPVRKISIVPRGKGALGFTLQLPTDQHYLATRSELLSRIRCALGGRAAEELVYGEPSTGAENDLDVATVLARQMVCIYGMSESVGLARCASRSPSPFLGDLNGLWSRDCSEKTAQLIDTEVKAILEQAMAEAKQILSEHQKELADLAELLLKKETIEGEEFYRLLGQSPPEPSLRQQGVVLTSEPPVIDSQPLGKPD
ncbi:ATP-dependent zinc metalloprotease FtsH [Candidatus Methylacidithermus pantelleriae]|uniref:ATP-dependent zinc metalloprotease FtsH n=1 Tax=Candidatus Methylacidithermus pantelleriae TaxID=2744239 RepID=A0A8J2BMN4_9BACT|nr:ATP-dependent zinc metalloprotease FtsH [Candidatus Methylacidithermus pantelleriae]CAF0691306.1 ATP-dependent zinc metalloprotease FtsH 1 [Candidatus Methylacidithermus pantelleriae]